MPDYLTQLLQNSSSEEILEILKDRLDKSDEADFWKEKIIPFTDAILSILIPLKKQDLLFNPEGKMVNELDSNLFFRWSDLVCLRILYFIIKQSNEKNELQRTEHQKRNYNKIEIEKLEKYLFSNRINITDEDILDFPVATYNLHIGVNSIIKNLLK